MEKPYIILVAQMGHKVMKRLLTQSMGQFSQ